MTPRGIRLCNPGNIRRDGIKWDGMSLIQSDPAFVQFEDAVFGIRAIVKILRSYKSRGLDTVAEAIARWAPSEENDTRAYIKDVCERCGVDSCDIVDYDAIMDLLIEAIIWHENGQQPYSTGQLAKGIALA